ncbi:MAG: hypothetical protein HY507_00575 [Candidatus Zambryskibacteria bacterium]|nr:hypothetical protein [Candidatus Zambryskibacteria bacterium]
MPKTKFKKVRITLDLTQDEFAILKEVAESMETVKVAALRKGMKILHGLKKEEYCLMTPKGEKIPTSLIFS